MATKMTVQFNLFGGTIYQLGTNNKHHWLLNGIDTLSDIGCFALTELGYGNNTIEMETTAILDLKTDEWIILNDADNDNNDYSKKMKEDEENEELW